MRAAAAVAAILLATLAAEAANPWIVEQDSSIAGLHAQRRALDLRFDVVATTLDRAVLSSAPSGTSAAPVEISETDAPAGTGVTAGHWVLTATVRERDVATVSSGRFVAELAVDGVSRGAVHLTQDLANARVREGARIAFDLGAAAPGAPLLLITVREVIPNEVAYELRSTIGPTLQYQWEGPGGVNPTLVGYVGAPMAITIVNDDGTTLHNFQILRDGDVVAGPTPDVEARGDRETLRWTPDQTGELRYECAYHGSMAGTLQVNP